ncbi:MAG: hypothetical protein P4L87_06880 [Formivibrio sp.]|nr:hypothetical protein [Formivibrio sp.]
MLTPASADSLITRASELAQSQSSEALELTVQARQLAAEHGAAPLEAAALCLHARILLMLGRDNEALAVLLQVHSLADQQNIGPYKGEALQLLGCSLFTQNHYQKAATCWQNCLALPSPDVDSKTLTQTHLDLGSLHLLRDQFALALEHHRQAETLALESDDPLLYSEAQLHIANDLVKQGQTVAALVLLKEALPQIRAAKNYRQEGSVYGLIGEIQLKRGELDKAQTSLMLALKINHLISCLPGEVVNLVQLGLCELRNQEIEGALDFLNNAQALAEESGSKHLRAWVEEALIETCLVADEQDAAAQHAANYQQLRADILDQSPT